MLIAIYARVSTSDQSCAMQRYELRQYAAKLGWRIYSEYVEPASAAPGHQPQSRVPGTTLVATFCAFFKMRQNQTRSADATEKGCANGRIGQFKECL